MKSVKPKLDTLQTAYDDAKKLGDKDLIKKTGKQLGQAIRENTLTNQYYQGMLDQTTSNLANVNQRALSYVNDQMPEIYTINYNQMSKNNIKGYNFALVDEYTVKALITQDDKSLVPQKQLNIPKDKQWNTKMINSQVLQGILQGESIDKIAKRLQNVTDMNEASAIRNARTMTTSAENKGRQDSYKQASEDGIVMKKVWIATGDKRTRAWHLDLDGEEVDVNDVWTNEYGDISYPGDPDADPCNVYNCRCSMRTEIIGFRRPDGSISKIEYERKSSEHDEEIENERLRRSESVKEPIVNSAVQGKDLSDSWIRRSDKFEFEIEDIIDAQGFTGLPKIVSSEEFDRYVSDSNIYMTRGYSASNKEIADVYRNDLYNGKFYVDCSGGSAYGQGMYAAGTSMINDEDKIDSVNRIGNRYTKENNFGYVEKMTLAKDTNIVSFDDLKEEIKDYTKDYDDKIDALKSERNRLQDENFANYKAGKIDKDTARKIDENLDEMYNSKKKLLSDPDEGIFAAMKGYDAIRVNNADGDVDYYVILNRTKLIIKGE